MAAVTLLSELGGVVRASSHHDEIITCLLSVANAKAGAAAGCEGTDGTMDLVDVNSSIDNFVGICLPRYDTDCDSVYTTGVLCELVRPISGHLYNVRLTNPSATLQEGHPIAFGDSNGEFKKHADIEDSEVIAYLAHPVITATTVATIVWG